MWPSGFRTYKGKIARSFLPPSLVRVDIIEALTPYAPQVAEILKDRPSWFRDCRAVDVLNVLPTANGGTIELLYMQVVLLLMVVFCYCMMEHFWYI